MFSFNSKKHTYTNRKLESVLTSSKSVCVLRCKSGVNIPIYFITLLLYRKFYVYQPFSYKYKHKFTLEQSIDII